MPAIEVPLKTGGTVALDVPPPGAGPSCFLIGLPKAGSTLLNRLMRPLTAKGGLAFFSLYNALHAVGVAMGSVSIDEDSVFTDAGYAYGGFRGTDTLRRLPAFANDRTVFLVRDPRDMLTSLYFSEAISHVPPGTALSTEAAAQFEARREAARAETIDAFARRRAADVIASYRRTVACVDKVEHRLYRYEDIIAAKEPWVHDMLRYLRLSVPAPLVQSVIARNDVTPKAEDPTQHIRRVAPGDHKDKLAPDTIAWLDEQFADVLARFGYATVGSRPAVRSAV